MSYFNYQSLSTNPGVSSASFTNVTGSDLPGTLNSSLAAPSASRHRQRAQSSRLFDDEEFYDVEVVKFRLRFNVDGRSALANEGLLGALFPDDAFGFCVNDQFIQSFTTSFLTPGGLIDPQNFVDDDRTSVYLNQIISTISHAIHSTNHHSLKDFRPLRYFTSLHSDKPVQGSTMKRKPDVILNRLIDGCTVHQGARLYWHDVQGYIEQTREQRTPIRMPETILSKAYLTFCAQPERNFLISLCITLEGFYVVLLDHAGSVETKSMKFDTTFTTIAFLRVLMGLAFLPDSFLGIDTTIIRRDRRPSSDRRFEEEFEPLPVLDPSISVIASGTTETSSSMEPLAVVYEEAPENYDEHIKSVTIGSMTYKVVKVVFEAKSLIGRSTRVFLVELPDGTRGVLKDSWITSDRLQEAKILEGLCIPFGPDLRSSIVLANTDKFRLHFVHTPATINECRQKRRVAMYPAGVHISDFTSLWELVDALLHIVLAILYLESRGKLHRDISYTNVLLREPGGDSIEKQQIKERLLKECDLLEIESRRKELGCREGLLVDYDYATNLVPSLNDQDEGGDDGGDGLFVKGSGVRTGTAPFIAIELLLYATPHRVAHDLESLFYVLLFICTHLQGPYNDVCDPPLYGKKGKQPHPAPIRHWFAINNLSSLGIMKYGHMFGHFETFVLPHISPYFQPLVPLIKDFWAVLHPQRTATSAPTGASGTRSQTNCFQVIKVFRDALLSDDLFHDAKSSNRVLGKRSLPGDLVSTHNGWEVSKLNQKLLKSKPRLKPMKSTGRQPSATMNKRRRAMQYMDDDDYL